MKYKDALGHLCTHKVQIRLRTLVSPKLTERVAARNAQRMFGRYGIAIEVLSARSLAAGAAKFAQLSVLDTACNWNERHLSRKSSIRWIHRASRSLATSRCISWAALRIRVA